MTENPPFPEGEGTIQVLPAPPAPAEPPSLGRALTLLGVSGVMMLLVFGAFYLYQTRARDLNAPLFAVTISIVAVLLPTVAAFYFPKSGAPGRLPRYDRPNKPVIWGTVLASLPLYAASAAMIISVGDWGVAGVHTTIAPNSGAAAGLASVSLGTYIGVWIAFAALPAIAEELMYRGMVQPAIAARWGPAWGIGVTAVLFAVLHMDSTGLLPRMAMGVWFGFLAWRTGSLWASTLAHALNNTWAVLLAATGSWALTHPTPTLAVAFLCLVLSLASFQLGPAFFAADNPKRS